MEATMSEFGKDLSLRLELETGTWYVRRIPGMPDYAEALVKRLEDSISLGNECTRKKAAIVLFRKSNK